MPLIKDLVPSGSRCCIELWDNMCCIIVNNVSDLSMPFMMADFDTKLRATHSLGVGGHAPAHEQRIGQTLLCMILKINLAVPGAFT